MALNEIRHKVVDFGDLHIAIYVLGYINEGESIMIELKCGEDVLFLLDPFDSNGIVSTTTVFGDEMPYPESIEKYKKKSSVIYSTGRGNREYGLITLDFPLREDAYNVYIEGNAVELK